METKTKLVKNEVIGIRTFDTFIFTLTIILTFVAVCLVVVGDILLDMPGGYVTLIGALTLFLFCTLVFASTVAVMIKLYKNHALPKNCIEFNAKSNELLITSLNNKFTNIKLEQYERCSYKLSDDHIFTIYYRSENNISKRIKVGFLKDPNLVERRIEELFRKNKLKK